MLIKSILEYNWLVWKERFYLLHMENEFTHKKCQREIIWKFCLHLRRNLHLVPRKIHHFLWKLYSFFSRYNFVGMLNWESRMKILLTVFKEKNICDIRKYMIMSDKKRTRNAASARAFTDEIDSKIAKRWKQTNMGQYYDVPAASDVTPQSIRIKKRRVSSNQKTLDEMNKRRKHEINLVVVLLLVLWIALAYCIHFSGIGYGELSQYVSIVTFFFNLLRRHVHINKLDPQAIPRDKQMSHEPECW